MLLPISEASSKYIAGGKGFNLHLLWSWGIQIPETYCLPVFRFRAFMEKVGVHEGLSREECRHRVLSAQLDPEEHSSIIEALNCSEEVRWAVRSSGFNEDGRQRSYAGQFQTLLGVATNDVPAAIVQCWASAFERHLDDYHSSAEVEEMSVLVQRMVEPTISGVLFTVNPRNGSHGEISIESVPGLGAKLVDGASLPDRYRLSRGRSYPIGFNRLINTFRSKEIERVERTHQPLTESEAKRLALLGLRIERLAGSPQDIEWALDSNGTIMVLQCRPITSGQQPNSGVVWTRQFLGERWSEPVTPLGWSHMGPLFQYFIEYPKVGARFWEGEPSLKIIDGAPYLNSTVFRHLIFKPWLASCHPSFFLEMLPADEVQFFRARSAFLPNFSVYASIIHSTLTERRWRRFRWNPFTNVKAWNEFVPELDAFLARYTHPPNNVEEALRRVSSYEATSKRYLGIHVPSYIFANLWWQFSHHRLESAGLKGVASTVLRSSRITATQRCNQALWELQNQRTDLKSFWREFGHRSTSSYALFAMRYAESETLVRTLARNFTTVRAPLQEANEHLATLEKGMASIPDHVKTSVTLAQEYLFLREEQRFHFDKLLWQWKQLYLWLERELQLQIRFLTKDELLRLLDGSEPTFNVAATIQERKRKWKRQKQQWEEQGLPIFLRDGKPVEYEASNKRKGTPVSSGVAFGPARLITSLEEGHLLQAGDILVIKQSDPSWTALYEKAAGIVMELGGALSHGAVIAREMKKPAVAGFPGVCSQLQNGDWIGLDGNAGEVYLREEGYD